MERAERPSLGELLRRHRQRVGLTQEELAERAELSVRQLVYLERGKHTPRPGTIRRLSKALRLSEEDHGTLLASVDDGTPTTQPPSRHGPGGALGPESPDAPPRDKRVAWARLPRVRWLLPQGTRGRAGLWRGGTLAAGVVALILALVVVVGSMVTRSAGAQPPLRPQPVAVWGPPPRHVKHFSQPDGIAVDRPGNVYVADFDRNTVQKLSDNGQPIAELGSGRGTGARLDGPTAVAVDAAGNLYVIDHGNRRLQKVSATGAVVSSWLIHGDGVAIDGRGRIDVVDGSAGVVKQLSAGGALLATWRVPGIPAGQALPAQPLPTAGSVLGIAADARGHVFVADALDHWFEELSATGRLVFRHRITEVPPPGVVYPEAVTVNRKGEIYVVDTGDALVLKYGPDGRFLARWGGAVTGSGAFSLPVGVAVDGRGSVYVADAQTARVDKLASDGRPLASWTRMGSNVVHFDDPQDMAVDRQGNLYVLEGKSALVTKVSPKGRLVTSWPVGRLSQPAPNLHQVPSAIAVDARSRVYVAVGDPKSETYRIEVWSSAGRHLHTIRGVRAATGLAIDTHGNLWVAEHITAILEYSPSFRLMRQWSAIGPLLASWTVGIAVDTRGNVYVPDAAQQAVIKLSPEGKILTQFAEHRSLELQDSGPSSEATDGQGRIYIAEPDRDQVEIRSPTGKLLQTLGGKGSAPGEFTTPVRVALDARGNLYVLDCETSYTAVPGDGRLQKFAPAG